MTANQPTALVAGASFGMCTVISPLRPPDTESGDFQATPLNVTTATGEMP
jgi:hypothetical protein